MTMNELVEYIAETQSVPSPEAKARIGRELNVRYKRVTTSIGLIPTRRELVTVNATIGNSQMTFTGVEKLDAVFRVVGNQSITLDEITNDEMLALPGHDEPPQKYSVFSITPTAITIQLDCTPTTTFPLYAHAVADASTLTSNDQPAFPESFHDVLIHGVMADEFRRKDKVDKARESEEMFEKRLSDLKMFIAKSAYMDLYRGKHASAEGWWDSTSSRTWWR